MQNPRATKGRPYDFFIDTLKSGCKCSRILALSEVFIFLPSSCQT